MTKQMEACCSTPASMCLLVRSLADHVGSAEPHRNLLASSPCAVSGCVHFRHGHRLPRQLAQKSLFSLRDYWAIISDRRNRVPALRRAIAPRQHRLDLDIRLDRDRDRISV